MRSLVFVCGLVLILFGSAIGAGMSLGVLGGVNLANVSADSLQDNESRLGVAVGIFFDMPIAPSISLQPQLLYVTQGTKLEALGLDAGMKMGYLDLPVLAKYNIPLMGPLTPSLFVGPYIGFNLSADAYLEDETEDIKDDVASTDYGLMLGGGLDMSVGDGELIFDARYILGMANINGDSSDDEVIKNSGIMFLLGYGFSL